MRPRRPDPIATVSPANGPGLKRVWGPIDNPVNEDLNLFVLHTTVSSTFSNAVCLTRY